MENNIIGGRGGIQNLDVFVRRNAVKIFILVGSGFFVYINSLINGFVSDDIFSIIQDPSIANLFRTYNLRSISGTLLSINYLISGVWPFTFHLTAVVLHLLVVFIGYYFLTLITSKRIAFFASLLFAVHPLNTEAVAWISGRVYPLYSIFLLLALIFYLKAREINNGIKWYLLSALMFIASTMSNHFAMSFPIFIVIHELSFGNILKKTKEIVFFFVLTVLSILMFSGLAINRISYLNQTGGNTSGGGMLQDIFRPIISIWYYIYLYLFPKNLSFYREDITYAYGLRFILLILSLAGILGLIYLFKKSRVPFFGILFYIASLGITLTPFKFSWVVAERYSYLGNIGLSLVLAFFIDKAAEKIRRRDVELYTVITLVFIFGLRTIIRNFDWKNEDTLWLATVKTSPTSSKAWNNMGDYYARHGDLQSSLNAFLNATRINPTYSDALHNVGNTLMQLNNFEAAKPYFLEAIKYNNMLYQSHNALALIEMQSGNIDEAEEELRKSLEITPNEIAHTLYGQLLLSKGETELAKEQFNSSLTLNPNSVEARRGLAKVSN